MGVVLVDLGNDDHSIVVGNSGWRGTLELIWPFEIIDPEKRERLETYWVGVEFTQAEAQAIGNAFVEQHLIGINWSDKVYPPTGALEELHRPKAVLR